MLSMDLLLAIGITLLVGTIIVETLATEERYIAENTRPGSMKSVWERQMLNRLGCYRAIVIVLTVAVSLVILLFYFGYITIV